MSYACGVCGLAVIVRPDAIIVRACSCDGAVVANLSSTLAGAGGVRI